MLFTINIHQAVISRYNSQQPGGNALTSFRSAANGSAFEEEKPSSHEYINTSRLNRPPMATAGQLSREVRRIPNAACIVNLLLAIYISCNLMFICYCTEARPTAECGMLVLSPISIQFYRV